MKNRAEKLAQNFGLSRSAAKPKVSMGEEFVRRLIQSVPQNLQAALVSEISLWAGKKITIPRQKPRTLRIHAAKQMIARRAPTCDVISMLQEKFKAGVRTIERDIADAREIIEREKLEARAAQNQATKSAKVSRQMAV